MGGIDLQLEEILAEGERFVQCETPKMLNKRKRARVAILAIRDLIPDIETRVKFLPLSIIIKDSIFRLVSASHIQFTLLRIACTSSHACHGYLSSFGCAPSKRFKLKGQSIGRQS
jgi:hypothetical protein